MGYLIPIDAQINGDLNLRFKNCRFSQDIRSLRVYYWLNNRNNYNKHLRTNDLDC